MDNQRTLNLNLTERGKVFLLKLLDKFLHFFEREGKTSLELMLKRWYATLEKEENEHKSLI